MNRVLEARYGKHIADYMGNPLIEALPPTQSYESIGRLLGVYPYFDVEERNDVKENRLEYIQRIFDYMQPLQAHITLYRKIDSVIKQSYINRNPLDKENKAYFTNNYELLMEDKLPQISKTNIKKRVQGFSVIGISGVGKTTAIDSVLKIFPQALRHTKYRGEKMLFTQIPWIKLECPPDGSTKGLCINFFRELDNILGTNYSERFKRSTKDVMLSQMGHLSGLYSVGVLIVDEVQHLSLQKSGGASGMLNFFVTLVNAVGVPVILIGTNKTFDLLNKEFRQARRVIGQGSSVWERLSNNIEWKMMMNGLFTYQWTKEPIEPDDEIIEVIYEESQGIIDVAKKIFILTQIEAIVQGTEKITSDLIRKTSKKHLGSLKDMLDAIRSGDSRKLNEYEDLKADITSEIMDLEKNLQESEFLKHRNEIENKKIKEEIQKTLNLQLLDKISDPNIIRNAVNRITNKLNVQKYNIDELYQKALTFAENEIEKKNKKEESIKVTELKNNDLRKIQQDALKNQQSTYSLLVKNDLIKDIYI